MQEYSCSMNDIGEVNIYQSDSEFLLNELNPTTYELIEVIKISNHDAIDIYVSTIFYVIN